jgi:hypothetical protein
MGDELYHSRPPWLRALRRILGLDCCGPWTGWETKEAEYEREPRTINEWCWYESREVVRIIERKSWQERRCTKCGYVQQRELRW